MQCFWGGVELLGASSARVLHSPNKAWTNKAWSTGPRCLDERPDRLEAQLRRCGIAYRRSSRALRDLEHDPVSVEDQDELTLPDHPRGSPGDTKPPTVQCVARVPHRNLLLDTLE